jgi:hypothetical protein
MQIGFFYDPGKLLVKKFKKNLHHTEDYAYMKSGCIKNF